MIKTKSRSCNSKKHPQNILAGYEYNPALKNVQCLIFGLTDLMLSLCAPKHFSYLAMPERPWIGRCLLWIFSEMTQLKKKINK